MPAHPGRHLGEESLARQKDSAHGAVRPRLHVPAPVRDERRLLQAGRDRDLLAGGLRHPGVEIVVKRSRCGGELPDPVGEEVEVDLPEAFALAEESSLEPRHLPSPAVGEPVAQEAAQEVGPRLAPLAERLERRDREGKVLVRGQDEEHPVREEAPERVFDPVPVLLRERLRQSPEERHPLGEGRCGLRPGPPAAAERQKEGSSRSSGAGQGRGTSRKDGPARHDEQQVRTGNERVAPGRVDLTLHRGKATGERLRERLEGVLVEGPAADGEAGDGGVPLAQEDPLERHETGNEGGGPEEEEEGRKEPPPAHGYWSTGTLSKSIPARCASCSNRSSRRSVLFAARRRPLSSATSDRARTLAPSPSHAAISSP